MPPDLSNTKYKCYLSHGNEYGTETTSIRLQKVKLKLCLLSKRKYSLKNNN